MRAADLVRKLLAFSRKQTVQREILDVGEMVSESEVLLRRLLYEDVKLVTDYGRNLPHVRADRGQLDTAIDSGGTVAFWRAAATDSVLAALLSAEIVSRDGVALAFTLYLDDEDGRRLLARTGGVAPPA
eukprot:gene202-296_t